MNRIIWTALFAAAVLLFLSDRADAAAGAETQPAAGRVAALKHLRIDLENRRVTVDAEVCLRAGPLELLLCKWGTKDYESILRTRAEPSDLHAAILVFGLAPGKPASWSPASNKTKAKFLPPRGAAVRIELQWKSAAGDVCRADAGRWLHSTAADPAPTPKTWIFVGSQVLPAGGYWADVDGDVISVSNFEASVIDVPFESSNQNTMLNFTAATDVIPPVGTKVQVIITPMPGAEKADHARAMLEIDRFGRLQLDGRPITHDDLMNWARGYIARHAKAQVFIRAEARSLAWDIARARQALELGGLKDIDQQVLPPMGEVLPRTPRQAKRSLKWWAGQFAKAERLIVDPVRDARATLRRIDDQSRRLDALKAMWSEYAAALGQMLSEYDASTRPASDDAGPKD